MLDQKLDEYAKTGAYPFHMPGHKRVSLRDFDPYSIDITEIPGFDDLHDAHDLIQKLQQGYVDLYGAQNAYISVNGSTLGNLAAIFSATERKDEILITAGCHRSVLHAAELNGLTVHTITPQKARGLDESQPVPELFGAVTPLQVSEGLEQFPHTRLLVITSPSYEGIISDIDEIVKVAHDRGVIVHIDGAHGAHHGLGGLWPHSIIESKADTAVLSLHKTLPAFTGSSVLLRSRGSRIEDSAIDHYLDCFETSSPSYILMYGMAVCLEYLRTGGSKLFEDYGKRLEAFYDETKDLKRVFVCRLKDHDISKIIISSGTEMTGYEIAKILRKRYGIETEMAKEGFCLALSSLMDDKEALDRLALALTEMNKLQDLAGI